MLQYLFILLLTKIFIITGISSASLASDCKYVSATLPTQIKVKNQNLNTRFVMDDLYKRFAKKYHMSSNMMKSCLENKYGKRNKNL